MLKIKTLASGAAAAALVSVIGLSYAQVGAGATDNSDAKPMEQAPTPLSNDTAAPSTAAPSDSTTASPSTSGSSDAGTLTERAPQADRN